MWFSSERLLRMHTITQTIPEYFGNVEGLEAIILYLWLCKDFVWMQALLVPGYFCIVMLFPCAYLVWMERHDRFMCMHAVATTFWLAGNWWWMIGENWDDNYHTDDGPVYESHTRGAEVLLSFGLITVTAAYVLQAYDRHVHAHAPEIPLMPTSGAPLHTQRLPQVFKSFHEYEGLHVLFWTGKDLMWALWVSTMGGYYRWLWALFAAATVLLAADITWLTRKRMVENVHAIVLLIWINANVLWAIGEFFPPMNNYDKAQPLGAHPDSWYNMRWWAAWLLVTSIFPITYLYVQWIPATLSGKVAGGEATHLVSPGATANRAVGGSMANQDKNIRLSDMADMDMEHGGTAAVAAYTSPSKPV